MSVELVDQVTDRANQVVELNSNGAEKWLQYETFGSKYYAEIVNADSLDLPVGKVFQGKERSTQIYKGHGNVFLSGGGHPIVISFNTAKDEALVVTEELF